MLPSREGGRQREGAPVTGTATVAPGLGPAGVVGGAGVLSLEVTHGAFLSAARPVLVVDSPEVREGLGFVDNPGEGLGFVDNPGEGLGFVGSPEVRGCVRVGRWQPAAGGEPPRA